jgi:hypothetical protein
MARAGINWARGLDELGAGLLRQADIGGLAYKDATTKEAERRAESRLISAERRALAAAKEKERRENIEWGKREDKLQSGRKAITSMGNTHAEYMARLREAGANKRLKKEIQARKDAASDLYEKQKEDAKNLAESKAEKDRVDRLMERAKTEASIFENLAIAHAKSDNEEDRGRLETELLLSVDRMEAAWGQAGLPKLSIDENLNEIKYRLIVPQIIFNVNSNVPKDQLQTVYKAFRDNDPESSVYKDALETLDGYIQEAIDKGMVPEYRSKTRTKTELTRRVIDYMSKNYAKELEDHGNGNTGETGAEDTSLTPSLLSSIFGGDPLDNIAPDITKEDIGTVKKAQAALDATPTTARGRRPSGHKSQLQKDLEKAKKRDPEYLLIHLKEEKIRIEKQLATSTYNTPKWVQERLDKINELIKRFSSMLPPENPQASALPPASNTSLPPGMLNTGGGMISSAGLSPAALAYWEPDVADARAKAMQRTA